MKHSHGPYARAQDDMPYFSTRFAPAEQHTEQTYTRRLLVDNRDRTSGSEFDFVVRFGNPYINASGVSEYERVKSVDIKMAAIPKIAGEQYAVIDIAELNDSTLDATNNAANQAFAVSFFDTSILSPGDVKPSKDFYSQRVVFNPPLNKLDRMSVKILRQNGNVVTTADTGLVGNLSLLFEIEVLK